MIVVGDLADLAQQIVALTRVTSDAKQAKPGLPVSLSVIPGLNPSIPATQELSGAIGGALAGPITGTLTPLITKVEIHVEYTVLDEVGNAIAASNFTTNPPLPASGSHPLDVEFLLRPPIGEDIRRTPATKYVIQVDVTVRLDGNEASTKNPPLQPLRVPVAMPAIGIPALLVLAQHPVGNSGYPGDALCMVRSASPLRSLDKVVETLNSIAGTLDTLKTVLAVASIANPFEGIELILDVFQKAPIVYFAVGGAPDFNEFGGWDTLGFGGFDDEASSALMLGVTGVKARVWSSEDFDDGDWHEHSTFEVPDLGLQLGLPVPLGFGIYRNDSFGDWDTDAGDSMHDEIESARFL